MQKNMKTHSVDPEKNGSQADGCRTLLQRWRFDYVFQKFENKIFLNYLAIL